MFVISMDFIHKDVISVPVPSVILLRKDCVPSGLLFGSARGDEDCYVAVLPSRSLWLNLLVISFNKWHARVEGRGTPPPLPLALFSVKSTKLNQVCFCQSPCLCMVLWKIICVDESQWEIVLITTPNDGSVIVIVALMHLLISDNGQVIGWV